MGCTRTVRFRYFGPYYGWLIVCVFVISQRVGHVRCRNGHDEGLVVAVKSLEVSLDKPLEMTNRLFFGNDEITLGLWTVIAEISGFDD